MKTIAKEGLQGGKGDNDWVGHHRHTHDPGIQQEPFQYGWLSLAPTPFPLVPALQKALTVRGYWLAKITTNPERLARAKSYVYDRVQSGQLKPKIAKAFRFEDVVEAYRYMELNEQIGKIVLTIEN